MKLVNIYGLQVKCFDEYPYDGFHDEILMFNRELVFEFDDGRFYIIYLDNKVLEYSIELLILNDKLLIEPNQSSKLETFLINIFMGRELDKIEFLHDVAGKKVILSFDDYRFEHLFTRLAVRFKFVDGSEIYLYSGEPERIEENEYFMFMESSVICMQIIDETHGSIRLVEDKPFCPAYIDVAPLAPTLPNK